LQGASPYCAGYYASKTNNLKVKFPKLAQEWHPTKNGKLSPKDVVPGSNKKVWWKCTNGHKWKAFISSRSKGIGNCKQCLSLKFKNRELAKEWHPTKNGRLTPEDVTMAQNKKVWWQCKKEHTHFSSVHNRANTGCPTCNKIKRKRKAA